MEISTTVLLCPRNDEESLTILRLAEAIGLSMVVSSQPHGAKLAKESHLLERILEINPQVNTVVIVEIPGSKEEEMLRAQGLDVHVIDHHRYDEVDRRNAKSSLEQFCEYFKLNDEKISALGFLPKEISWVAAIDRGFVWELREQGYAPEEIQQALAYYRTLTLQLGEARREKEETAAKIAWEAREEKNGILMVRSVADDISIRDALSFLVATTFEKPQTVFIVQGHRRMYVQDTDAASALFDRFGGFTFGGDRCWGILKDDGNLPKEEEILEVLVRAIGARV
ncbi:MAG: hypothetical protein WC730_01860 [Patescibacteria group bacterium]|jgi:hypothetical protein